VARASARHRNSSSGSIVPIFRHDRNGGVSTAVAHQHRGEIVFF
jgi:hypothetical protein